MKIYLDNNLGVANVEQEELTQDTIGYNILKVYIPNTVLTPYDTFTCYYGALLQNGRKVGWFAMEARTSSDADYEANYTLYKATLEQCVVSVEGKVYIGCQVILGNSGNTTLIKKNTAVVQFNVRKSVAINNDILVLDTDQTTTDVLESYKNLLENALLTYATKAEVYTQAQINTLLLQKADKSDTYTKSEVYSKTETNALLDTKADKSDTYTKAEVDEISKGDLYVTKMYGNLYLNVDGGTGDLIYDASVHNRYVDPNWYHLQIGDRICFNGNENYRYWLAVKTNLSDNSITDTGWLQEDYTAINECYVRISVGNADDSNFTMDFVELLDEDVVLIYTKKPITTRLGSIYNDKINSYLFYSGVDVYNNRLRTNVLQFKKGDIINFKEYGTEYAWAFMGWNFDGTLDLDTGWKTSNFYVVPKDYKAVIIFKKSDYAQSLLLKGNIYYQKGLNGATNTATCVIVLDNTCVKTGDTITITNGTNALDFKVDFLSDQWGQGTTTLQTIAYGTTSATVTVDMDSVKNVVITIKKSDGTAFSNISSELLWYIYRTSNITKSNGEYFDTEAIYDVDFEVNGEVEPTKFNSNLVQIGHRGWDEYAPENTIPSFDLAYKLGCRFLEGDIQFTSDGVPVMLHDATLNRTARNEDGNELSSTINIANITYAQALEYDFGIYQGDLYQGTKIPTFEEMIKWLKLHNDVYFQIDLTTGSWSNSQVLALYKIVSKYGMFDNLIWESGSSATVSYLISLGVKPKNTMVSYYSSITTANVDTAYNLGCKVFSIQYSLATYSLIQYVISKGMKPYIWFDSADKYAYNVYRLTNLGVVGFYNTNISDIYALRWFKTFVGIDGNTASSITDKDTALLNQAYSDIATLQNSLSTTTEQIATLERETENLKTAIEGNLYNETDAHGLAYEVALSNPLPYGKVNKVGGMSYKSENLLALQDVVETTTNGITYKVENGIFSISGTATQRVEIRLMSYAFKVGTYSVKVFDIQNLGSVNVRFFADAIMSYSNLTSTTLSNTFSVLTAVTSDFGFVVPSGANVNATFKYMLVSGSTAPTTYKPYFDGIRDTAPTSVTIIGNNKFDGTYINATWINTNTGGVVTNNDAIASDYISLGGLTSVTFSTNVKWYLNYAFYDSTKTFISGGMAFSNNSTTITDFAYSTASVPSGAKYVRFSNHKTSTNAVYGTTPSEYTEYKETTKPIPASVQALDGYGWGISESVCNYIDYNNKKFVQKVGRAKISDLSWTFDTSTYRSNVVVNNMQVATTRTLELLLSGYDSIHNGETYDASWDKVIYSTYPNTIYVTNKSYSSLEQFLTNDGNKYIYYPLETPIETDISQYLTGDDFDVLPNLEPNGSITLDNTYQQEAVYDITTLEKVSV